MEDQEGVVSIDITGKATECGIGDKLFASAAHITLDYMRLEYTPTQENNDTYSLAPYWAVYAHSEQGSSLFICIDAQTGETVIQEI